jgi:hypothetical protein
MLKGSAEPDMGVAAGTADVAADLPLLGTGAVSAATWSVLLSETMMKSAAVWLLLLRCCVRSTYSGAGLSVVMGCVLAWALLSSTSGVCILLLMGLC